MHTSPDAHDLTPRQREVLDLIARGCSSAEIAARLHRSIRTVESHRHALNKRMGTRNSVELIRRAIELGLVDPGALAGDRSDRVEPIDAAERRLLVAITTLGRVEPGMGTIEIACEEVGAAFGAERVSLVLMDDHGGVHRPVGWAAPDAEDDWPEIVDSDREAIRHREGSAPRSRLLDAEQRRLTILPLAVDRTLPPAALAMVHPGPLARGRIVGDLLRSITGRVAAEYVLAASRVRQGLLEQESLALQRQAGVAAAHLLVDRGVLRLGGRAMNLLGVDRSEVPLAALAERDRRGDPERVLGPVREATGRGAEFFVRLEPASEVIGGERAEGGAAAAPRAGAAAALGLTGQPGPFCPIEGRSYQCFLTRLTEGEGVSSSLPLPVATALADLVDRCDDPLLLVDGDGRTVVGNHVWRSLVASAGNRDWGLDPAAPLRSWFGEDVAERVAAAIERLASAASLATAVSIPTPEEHEPAVASVIDVEPMAGLSIAFVRLRRGPRRDGASSPAALLRTDRGGLGSDARIAELFDWVFEQSSALMAIAGIDGRLRRANPAYLRLLGLDAEAAQRRSWIEFIAASDHDRVRESLSRLMGGEGVERFPLTMLGADGSERVIEWTATPPVPGTNVFMALGRDVTEQVRARHLLEHALSRFPGLGGHRSPGVGENGGSAAR